MTAPGPDTPATPRQVLERFYEAESRYMQAGGSEAGVSFEEMGATLASDVVLHQSPDLPWGGDWAGHEGFRDWADAMIKYLDRDDVLDRDFFEKGDKIIVVSRLVTRSRTTGVTTEHPFVQVVTVENGKITDFRPFYWNVRDYVAATDGGSRQEGARA